MKKIIVSALCLAWSLGSFSSAAELNDDKNYKSALKSIEDKKFSQAVESLKKIENTFNDNYSYNAIMGRCYYEMGDDLNAQKYLQKSVQQKPDNISSRNYLGASYFYSGNIPAAEKEYLESIKINKDQTQPYYILGLIREKQKRINEAVTYLGTALKYEPEGYFIIYRLGYIKFQQNQFNESEKYLKRCYEKNPMDYPVVSMLIQINHKKNNIAAADSLKKQIRKIRKSSTDRRITGQPYFQIDSFVYKKHTVDAMEAFETEDSLFYHWTFLVTDPKGDMNKTVNLESSDVLRELGEAYIIGIDIKKNNKKIHRTTNISFKTLPSYDEMKKYVIKEIDGGLPTSTSSQSVD